MAYLLGAAAVMESLQTDVRDVQTCVADIVSRVGPVNFTSWKFPDKMACNLDIEDLLDLYSYSDDEEERQVAHIALYELVIDRLVLLLHLMATYTEGVLRTARMEAEPCKAGTSVGVVVKKYWTRLSQLQQVVKQVVTEKNSMNRKVTEMEGDIGRLETELKHTRNTNRPKTAGMSSLIPPNRAEMVTGLSFDPSQLTQFGLISKDEYNKSCQTSETAFTPCDSCSIVQKSFRQSGEIIVNICQQQQIPSCLQKFRPQVSHLDWLSGNDVSRWSMEQNKDLQRISKLTATIKPLKDELSDCQHRSNKLENRVLNFDRDMKKEKDERSIMHKQYEAKLKEMELQYTQTIELEKQQRDLLVQNKEELEKLVQKHKLDLQEQQSLLRNLETTKAKLEGELSSNKVNSEEVQKLEGEMTDLQSKLGDISTKMEKSSKELQKEQARYKNAEKNNKSLQTKQHSLLQRIDALDHENRDLQDQMADLEEEKEKFEDTMNEAKRETTQLQRKLREKESEIEHAEADKESLEQTISTLETSLQTLNDKLEEAKERERLIVEYPDINGPVNPDLTGTGDIIVDMEHQIKANNIRIQLLESQNEGLRNSVSKLLHIQQQQQEQEVEPQQDRWATHVKMSPAVETSRGVKKREAWEPTKPQPLWNQRVLQQQTDTQLFNDPEYSTMENKYNQSGLYTRQEVAKDIDIQKMRGQSRIQTIEFDEAAVKTKSSPSKDRPPFVHRPLTGNSAKNAGSEFIIGKAMRPESAKIKHGAKSPPNKSRPVSGKSLKNVPAHPSSAISAYMQLKKQGKLTSEPNFGTSTSSMGSRPTTGKTRIPTGDVDMDSNYSKPDNYMCSVCDKMYTRQKDLEIHMSYCTG